MCHLFIPWLIKRGKSFKKYLNEAFGKSNIHEMKWEMFRELFGQYGFLIPFFSLSQSEVLIGKAYDVHFSF